MAGPTIDEVKGYLRIDGGEDDSVLALLVDAAKEYLTNSGVTEPKEDEPEKLYTLAVMLHVALNYENRDPSQKLEKFSYALESIILQLKVG